MFLPRKSFSIRRSRKKKMILDIFYTDTDEEDSEIETDGLERLVKAIR